MDTENKNAKGVVGRCANASERLVCPSMTAWNGMDAHSLNEIEIPGDGEYLFTSLCYLLVYTYTLPFTLFFVGTLP